MFIDRKNELNFLIEKYKSQKPEFIILWGRRRIGKTSLLKEFTQSHPSIYFFCLQTSTKENLEGLSSAIYEFTKDELLRIRPFESWDEVFIFLKEKIKKRTAIIIDEFPYLTTGDPAIISRFQKGWDEHLSQNHNIFLILTGSSIAMMEENVLGSKSPLYGRRTGQWKLTPFSLFDMKDFFLNKTFLELFEIYAVVGGVPYYAVVFDKNLSLEENIKKKILKKGEVLYEEVEFLLREELREPRNYFPILSAIALGNHKFGNIAQKTGFDKGNLIRYLSILQELHLVYRDVPITEKSPHKSKKGLYFIDDNFVNFWFCFVRPNKGLLEQEKIDLVWEEKIRPQFDYYISRRAERALLQIIERSNLPFELEQIGRYWSKDVEIDIVGFDARRENYLVGEIKWQKSPVDISVLSALKDKVAKEREFSNKKILYSLISKSGFTDRLKAMEGNDLLLIDLGKDLNLE